MRKMLKELITYAPKISKGKFASFMVISNGEYNGFWGKNGYDNLLILAEEWNSGQWYKLTEYADKFTIFELFNKRVTFNMDIPKGYGVPRFWFDTPIEIDYSLHTSDCMGYARER